MDRRAIVNADGELLLDPAGRARFTHDHRAAACCEVAPGEIALAAAWHGCSTSPSTARAAPTCAENYGAPFRLPELGPIGSNGLANARDFLAHRWRPSMRTRPAQWEIVKQDRRNASGARSSRTSPFNVVAWHGNLVPLEVRHASTS